MTGDHPTTLRGRLARPTFTLAERLVTLAGATSAIVLLILRVLGVC